MKTKSSTHVERESGSLLRRIDIRTEIGAGDGSLASSLDIEDTLGRNAVVYPFGDRLWGDTKDTCEFGLGTERLKNSGENATVHNLSFIHRQFMPVNEPIIAHKQKVDEAWRMEKRVPQPENYATFSAWVLAAAAFAGGQAALARAVKVSPQMLTRYINGGGAKKHNLQKFADWAQISYSKLRDLMEGRQTQDNPRQGKDRPNQTFTPLGAQIGRQWEQIADERARSLIAEQIQHELERQAQSSQENRKKYNRG